MARPKLDADMETDDVDDDDLAWGDEAEPDEDEPTAEEIEQINAALDEQFPSFEPFMGPSYALTKSETEQLARLEQTIESGLKTFVDVGTALMVVRDRKLYRVDYKTFEAYCRGRWGMGRSRVYQMIDAAMVVDNLKMSTMVDILPDNERQARELAKLEPSQQVEAWNDAVEDSGGKPTAADVQRAVLPFAKQVIAERKPIEPVRKATLAPAPEPVKPTYLEPEPKPSVDRVELTLRAPSGEVVVSTKEEPKPKLSHHEMVMRDIDHYDATARAEILGDTAAEPEPTTPAQSVPVSTRRSDDVWAESTVMIALRVGLADKLLRCVQRSSLLYLSPSEHDELKAILEAAVTP